jgi:hypothetical protein
LYVHAGSDEDAREVFDLLPREMQTETAVFVGEYQVDVDIAVLSPVTAGIRSMPRWSSSACLQISWALSDSSWAASIRASKALSSSSGFLLIFALRCRNHDDSLWGLIVVWPVLP